MDVVVLVQVWVVVAWAVVVWVVVVWVAVASAVAVFSWAWVSMSVAQQLGAPVYAWASLRLLRVWL